MKCLRCNTEMKHYECKPNFLIYGSEHQQNIVTRKKCEPHNIHSIYICDKCGYAEFSTKYCESPDI